MRRREILKSLAIAGTSFFPRSALPKSRERVTVIGAGLAGLAAATELTEAGHQVTVLEAQPRPGGRVLTFRDPFTSGLYAEAGAIAFADNSANALRYATALHVEMKRLPVSSLGRVYNLRGRRFTVRPGEPGEWPYELSPKEKALGPDGILSGIVTKLNSDVGPRTRANWLQNAGRRFDHMAVIDLLRAGGATAEAQELLRWTAWYTASADTESALQAVLSGMTIGLPQQQSPFAIPGGNDTLPKAMAARLGKRIRYNSTVKRIEQVKGKVRVVVTEGTEASKNATRTIESEIAVCTLPFHALQNVDLVPALSKAKAEAVRSLKYQCVTRVFLQMKRRYWVAAGNGGDASTDLAIMQVLEQPLHSTSVTADSPGILESYTQAGGALAMKDYSPEERVRITLNNLESVHPGAHNEFSSSAHQVWDHAYSCYEPNQFSVWYPDLIKPEGRVYFAGEHISTQPGTMEGALESGVRVAKDILHL